MDSNGLREITRTNLPKVAVGARRRLAHVVTSRTACSRLSGAIASVLNPIPRVSVTGNGCILYSGSGCTCAGTNRMVTHCHLTGPGGPGSNVVLSRRVELAGFAFNSFALMNTAVACSKRLIITTRGKLLILGHTLAAVRSSCPLPSSRVLAGSVYVSRGNNICMTDGDHAPNKGNLVRGLVYGSNGVSASRTSNT